MGHVQFSSFLPATAATLSSYAIAAGVKRELLDTVKARKLWSKLRPHHEETRERDNARNNARCTHARKTTHGLDGQHQDVDRTPPGRVNQNDRRQR